MAGRLTSPRTLVMGSLNMRGCSSIESIISEIGCTTLGRTITNRGMDVLGEVLEVGLGLGGWME